jgi:hypothetical protein
LADLDNRDLSVLKVEICSIKDELEDHLHSINESTDEIENNYSYVMELDERVKLIEKKLDVVLDFISHLKGESFDVPKIDIRLNEQEEEIFMSFYSSNTALGFDDLCRKTGKSESFVRFHLNNIISKGVPIKRYSRKNSADKAYFVLDPGFRELQTKNNVLKLARNLTLDCFDQKII